MKKQRSPKVARLPVTFHAKKDHVVAIYEIDGKSSIGMRFESPEQMLSFFSELMEAAVQVWPNNEWIREYLR